MPEDTQGALRADLAPVKLARPGRRVAAVAVALVAAGFVYTVFANPNFQWGVVSRYLFNKDILAGVRLTIELTVSAMAIGVSLGLITALMRLSDNPLLSGAAAVYTIAFRGTPALVQLIFWYNLAALFPRITIGIPFFGPEWFSVNANAIITPTVAANLGLGLCEGAYMAEIVRAGIMSVDPGQREAGVALGLTRAQTMWRVILPQALRVIVPPTGNQIIGMLKLSSLASVISVTELLSAAGLIYTRTFETIPLLIVASLWYIALTGVLSLGQRVIERRLGRSVAETGTPGRGWARWRAGSAETAGAADTAGPD